MEPKMKGLLIAKAATQTANEDSMTVDAVMTTAKKDRDGDIVEPGGLDFTSYLTNPVVLWGHNTQSIPIGRAISVRVLGSVVSAKVEFDKGNELARDVFGSIQRGFLRAWSIGFIPKGIEKLPVRRTSGNQDSPTPRQGFRITQAEVVELSAVAIGSNPDALTRELEMAMTKEFKSDLQDLQTKSAIPHAKHPLAPEDTAWDAAKEVKAASTDGLRVMCAWVDPDNNKKSAYKLPHHRQRDKHTVWRAVSAAMGALLGARGGVDIPAGDRKAVYNHLAKHYDEFDMDAPTFKSWEPADLDALIDADVPDFLWDSKSVGPEAAIKPYPNEHSARLQDPKTMDRFRRKADGKIHNRVKVPTTIDVIWGHPKDRPQSVMIPQALRFPVKDWSEADARAWLKAQEIKIIKFEAATGKQKDDKGKGGKYNCTCIECGHALSSDEHCANIKCPKCGGQMRRAERPGPGQPGQASQRAYHAAEAEVVLDDVTENGKRLAINALRKTLQERGEKGKVPLSIVLKDDVGPGKILLEYETIQETDDVITEAKLLRIKLIVPQPASVAPPSEDGGRTKTGTGNDAGLRAGPDGKSIHPHAANRVRHRVRVARLKQRMIGLQAQRR